MLLFVTHAVAAPFAYIANSGSNTVTVIDIATNTVAGSPIPVGTQPYGVAANTQGTRVYVTNAGSNSASVIDTATSTVIATISVDLNPRGIAVNAAGTRVYVANRGPFFTSGTVSVIDTGTNAVVATLAVPSAYAIAVNPAGTRVYVTQQVLGSVAVIDSATNTIISTVADPLYDPNLDEHAFIGGVAVDPAGTRIYVDYAVQNLFGRIGIIDAQSNTVLNVLSHAGSLSHGVAVDRTGSNVFMASPIVLRFNTALNAFTGQLFASAAEGVAVDPTGSLVYVVNPGTNSVSVVSAATMQPIGAAIAVGNTPVALGLFIGPGAPLTQAAVSPIPTLGGWAVVLLALLVASTAGLSRRR